MKKIKLLKFIIYLSIFFIFSLNFSLSVKATAIPVDMPILPYIPPSDEQLFDMLSNAYGVTAPDISNKTQKLQAYWDLYKQGLGASYEIVRAELEERFNSAKTSGQLFIPASLGNSIQEALTYALNNGYGYGEQLSAVTDGQTLLNRLNAYGLQWDLTNANFAWERLSQQNCNIKYLVFENNKLVLVSWSSITYNETPKINAIDSNRFRITKQDGSFINPQISADLTITNGVIQNVTYSNFSVGVSTFTWGFIPTKLHLLTGIEGNVATVQSQSQEITNALSNESVKPITADTDLTDNTGSFTIKLPNIIIVPATSVSDLEAKQEQLGVVPTTPDATAEQLQQIVNELQQSKSASLGDIPTYSIDLTEYFPFCIPFDIGNILTILIAEPEAPSFDWDFPSGYENGEVQYTTVNIDLSVWDPVAAVLRGGLILVFIIGLGMVTRSVFLRG